MKLNSLNEKQIDDYIKILNKSIKHLEKQKKYLLRIKANKNVYSVNPEEGD